MDLIPVSSSNIAAVGHEGDTLTIQFRNGTTWQYRGVPPLVYQSLMSSESRGKFFAQHIRPAYGGEKVG